MSPNLPSVLRIGTRESKLSRVQTSLVVSHLAKHYPQITVEIVAITTSGCKVQDRPIADIGVQGVFTKELQDALIQGQVDLVVHSMKDLPTESIPGLSLACVFDRQDPRDVLVSKDGEHFMDLPSGARIATSSRRRSAQLLALRKDVEFVDIRGNVDTRLSKQAGGACDAMVLAAAGLLRLHLQDRITEYFDPQICTPAVGQGTLAIECRQDNMQLCELLQSLEDPAVRRQITAERAFLSELGGGCSVPIGANCSSNIAAGLLDLTVCVASLDGSKILRASDSAPQGKEVELGKSLAQTMIEQGASTVLAALRVSPPNAVSAP